MLTVLELRLLQSKFSVQRLDGFIPRDNQLMKPEKGKGRAKEKGRKKGEGVGKEK